MNANVPPNKTLPYPRIVILTGAGVSAESGIRTFRAADGLWEDHRIEDVATPEGFMANPTLVHDFYNARRRQLFNSDLQPNKAHHALAQLEQDYAGDVLLITQNVDNLHERAGSQQLIHMHGELLQMICSNTGQVFPIDTDLHKDSVCACCQQSGNLRPNIVWFGEMPLDMERIYQALEQCELFIAIGTSGQVYPAAGFVQIAQQCGAHTVELNLEASGGVFHEGRYGPATQVVPAYIEQLMSQ